MLNSENAAPSLRLRPAVAEDEPFLRALYATTREQELALVPWPDEIKAAFCDSQFTAQDTHYKKFFPQSRYLVVEIDAEPVGRLYVDHSCEEVSVIDIALLPARRNTGLGTQLMRDVMAEAQASGKSVNLYVDKASPALRLYERLGYQVVEDKGLDYFMRWTPASDTASVLSPAPAAA